MGKFKYQYDDELIQSLYDDGLDVRQIAVEVDIPYDALYEHVKKKPWYGKHKPKPDYEENCSHCGLKPRDGYFLCKACFKRGE